jgi:NADH-quinone oxidoreductase subunit M
MGPIKDKHFLHLEDANWYERLSTITLVVGITFIGMAPLWLSDMINFSLAPLIAKLATIQLPGM